MTKKGIYLVYCIIFSICPGTGTLCAQNLRMVNYNILNFPDALGMERIDDIRAVLDYIQPDVLGVQEMLSQYGCQLFLDSVLNYQSEEFAAVPFHDGPDTDSSIFYRTDKVAFISAEYIPTPTRDIAEYTLRIKSSQNILCVYLIHFKASQGAANESLRLQEATILRNHLDSLGPQHDLLTMGDFNFYYDEAGFHRLIDSTDNNNGRLFDPLDAAGQWHDNIDYAPIHSQSSRVENLPDGGAPGGLDDRFDMVLCSNSLLDSGGLYLQDHSYTICGNDGDHFNMSINDGVNQVVPSYIADGLYYASDHLPVYADLMENVGGIVAEQERVRVWPNFVRKDTRIHFPYFADFKTVKVALFTAVGRKTEYFESMDSEGVTLDCQNMPAGIYFIDLNIETAYSTYNFKTKFVKIK